MPSDVIPSESLSDGMVEEESSFSRWTLPFLLFALTVFTTLWAGAYQAYSGTIRGPGAFLWEHPEMLPRGIPFAGTLLLSSLPGFGHFILSKIHRVPASLPLFIPGPPHLSGPSAPSSGCGGPL